MVFRNAGILLSAVLIFALPGCASFKADGKAADRLSGEIQKTGPGETAFRGSRLDRNGPVPYLVLAGSPREQGLAYGVLLRDEIARVSVEGKLWLDYSLRRVPAFFRPFVNLGTGFYLRQLENRTPRRYLEEIKGMSEGAGVPWEALLLSAYGVDARMGCTSVLSLPADGSGLLHGRNFDFPLSFLGKYPVLIRYKAAEPDEIDYWSLGTVAYPGAFHGGNGAGISVSINMAGKNKNKDGYSMGWEVRDILSGAGSLEAVRRIVARTPADSTDWVLSVGSARENAGIVFDLMGGLKAEESVKPGKPELILNRAFGDGRHLEDGLARKYLDAIQHMYGEPRWKAAQDFLARNRLDTPQAIWGLLRNRDTPFGFEVFNTRATTIARAETLFTAVFDLAKGQISFSTGETYASLRQAWLFDTDTETFSPFLPEADALATRNFIARENTYLALMKARLEGSLTLDALGDIDPETLDPATLDDFGAPLGYLGGKNQKIEKLLRLYYSKYANTDGYSTAVYAFSLAKTDKRQAISILEEALACPYAEPFVRLYIQNELVALYGQTGQRGKAAENAEKWLLMYDDEREGYSSKNPWIVSRLRAMKALARNKK